MKKVKENRESLILNNIKLVYYIYNKLKIYLPCAEDKEDMIAAGIISLIHAADYYDITKKINFSTYAGRLISLAMKKEMAMHIMPIITNEFSNRTVALSKDIDECKNVNEYMTNSISTYDHEEGIDIDLKLDLYSAINKLRPKHQYVIKQYFFNDKTQLSIADNLNVHRTYISKLVKEAVDKLKILLNDTTK